MGQLRPSGPRLESGRCILSKPHVRAKHRHCSKSPCRAAADGTQAKDVEVDVAVIGGGVQTVEFFQPQISLEAQLCL